MRILLTFLFFSLSSLAVYAQQADSIAYNLDEIEVSAQLRPSTTRSATPLQILTDKDFALQGIQSVSDAVKRFSGVTLKDYGGIGGLKTVSIRGMGAEYTTVSYDGMIVSNSQSGQVDIGRFTLDNISMLSLSIGQEDNIFQTAKAFSSAGVLSLQTAKPHFGNKKYTAHTKVSTGSFGYVQPMVDVAYKVSDKTAIRANVDWQRADGRYPFKMNEGNKWVDAKRINSDIDALRTELNLYNRLSSKDNLDIKLYYFDSERGLPGSVTYHVTYHDYDNSSGRLWDKNAFAQIAYERKFNRKWKWKSIAKYDYYYQKYSEDTFGDSKRSSNKYRQNEVYWSHIVRYGIHENWSATLSQDFIFNSLRSSLSSYNESRSEPNRYSSYTNMAIQYKTQRLSLTASGLNSYIYEKITNKDKKNIYRKFSPSFSASIQPFEASNFRLRTSYKHVYRIPTFNEIYFVATGKYLKPESSSQYNVGTTWAGTFGNSPVDFLSITVDAYYNNVKDKILIRPTMHIPTVRNLEKVTMKGIDTKLTTNIKVASNIHLDISGAYSYIHAYNDDKTSTTYKGQLAYTPKHSGSTSLTIRNPWVDLSYTLIASGARYTLTENVKKIESYTDHSISAFKEMNIKGYNLYSTASLLNILNKNYDVIEEYPMPRRSFRISVGCKF